METSQNDNDTLEADDDETDPSEGMVKRRGPRPKPRPKPGPKPGPKPVAKPRSLPGFYDYY